MTRTGPSNNTVSWETKSVAPEEGNRIDSVAGHDARPKGRIRRSMTACNTCRKLKTRCDVDPRGHACRRCLSLRFVRPFSSFATLVTATCSTFALAIALYLPSHPNAPVNFVQQKSTPGVALYTDYFVKGSNVNSQRHQSGSRTMHQPGPMLLPCPR
jgi:hypothetical protein